jgi:SWI/SNF-related matrix-associated actin-dependent regulator of chromatin subfamily A3
VKEPSWNPAIEDQAIDRLHRLGQTKQVNVYQYYVHGTIEMNILQIQRRKGELAL